MISRLRRLYAVRYPYSDPLDYRHAVILQSIIFIGIAGSLLVLLVAPLSLFGSSPNLQPYTIGVPIFVTIMLLIEYQLVQRGWMKTAVWILVLLMLFVTSILTITLTAPVTYLLVPMVAAGLLMNRQSLSIVIVLIFAALLARALVQSDLSRTVFTRPAETADEDFAQALLVFGISAFFFLAFSGTAERTAALSSREARQLVRVHALSAKLAETQDENVIFTHTLYTAQVDLDYTLAQIFLINADRTIGRRVRLAAGQETVTSSTSISAGDAMVVGQAARESAVIRASADDAPPRNIHVVAPSRWALAIPVIVHNQPLAVLNVQTDDPQGITDTDIEVLQALAQQLGVGLARARLINDLNRSLREQEESAARMRTQLNEIQGRTRQMVLSGWANYVQARGGIFGYDFSGQPGSQSEGKFILASDLTPTMREALLKGDVVVERASKHQIVNAPILLRGEVLGAMSFTIPLDQPVSERQLDLAKTIAVRLGIALENTRLFEQSQAQAARERKATEVANQLLTTTDMTALVNQAAETFYEALGAVYTRVIVQPMQADAAVSENGNGHIS